MWHPSLFLLPLLGWFVYLDFNSRAPISRARKKIALFLRLSVVLLLILALGPWSLKSPNKELNVIFLVDESLSISQELLREEFSRIRESAKRMTGDDSAGLICFGGEPAIEFVPTRAPRFDVIYSQIKRSTTNLNQALQASLGLFPQRGAKRVVLVSDGQENVGQSADIIPLLKSRKVEVWTRTLGHEEKNEILVRDLIIPRKISTEERFDIEIPVESTYDATCTLILFQNRRQLGKLTRFAHKGFQIFRVPHQLTEKGFYEFEVQLEASGDRLTQNNVSRGFALIEGKPRVLIVEDAPSPMVKTLKSFGIDSDTLHARAFPGSVGHLMRYDAVIFNNIPSHALSNAQMELILAYVRDFGGGFMMTGGYSSFGAGGYLKTPVEEALPVTMDIKARMKMPPLGLVMVVDKSGSMGGTIEGPQGSTKLDLAKEAAKEVAKLFYDKDLVGLVAFDDTGEWVVPLQSAGNKTAIISLIGQLREGGGTFMYPGMLLAFKGLQNCNASVKHCIVMSDGLTSPGDHENLAKDMVQNNITLSTIALGRDADLPFMENLAKIGQGRFYFTEDAGALPRIFLQEALLANKAVINEEPHTPAFVDRSEILRGVPLETMPSLKGFVETTEKDLAKVYLVSTEKAPILASWRKGVGKSVAFTSDVYGKWTDDWSNWEGFSRIIGQSVRFLMTETLGGKIETSFQRHGNKLTLHAEVYDAKGDLANMANIRFSAALPKGLTFSDEPMRQIGPGEYEIDVNADEDGSYFFQVFDKNASGTISSKARTGFSISYSPEFGELLPNKSLMADLASDTNGREILKPEDYKYIFAHSDLKTFDEQPLWPWFVSSAILLFVLDIAIRRIMIGEEELNMAWNYILEKNPFAGITAPQPTQSGLAHLKKIKIISPSFEIPFKKPNVSNSSQFISSSPTPASSSSEPASGASDNEILPSSGSSVSGESSIGSLKSKLKREPFSSSYDSSLKSNLKPAGETPKASQSKPSTATPPGAPEKKDEKGYTSRLLAAKKRINKRDDT